jgi:DNA-directed RNA polymerase specialized sigma24 family protein
MSRMERDDDALVNRAAAGDEESFADLVKRHIDSVWRVASGMTRNRADVEEVCQNASFACGGNSRIFAASAISGHG